MVSIPGRVIPKTLKMVLNTSLLNTQQYKVRIKGKVKLSRERSSTGCPRGVTVKAMDYGIVAREFVLQSRYYVHFWANINFCRLFNAKDIHLEEQ